MAANVLASMLDELMGRDRNLAPSDRKNDTRWDDTEVRLNVNPIRCLKPLPIA